MAETDHNKQQKEIERQLLENYRMVFNTERGKLVLAHLLIDLGVFNELKFTEEEMALHNAGVRILHRLGIIKAENVKLIIDALLKIPITLDKK